MAGRPFNLSQDELDRVVALADRAIRRRPGVTRDLREIQAAVGALFTGLLFGYRVLDIVHSGRTRAKY